MSAFYKSEKCFRRYEPAISLAVKNFPAEVSFMPEGGRSINTEAARCRDAIASWLKERWPTEAHFDAAKVGSLRVYTTGDGSIKVGSIFSKRARQDVVSPAINLLTAKVSKDSPCEPEQPKVEFTIETGVAAIDSGEYKYEISFPNTPENISRVTAAVEGRLNVAFYVKDEQIKIF
jgi:hypothetical protein